MFVIKNFKGNVNELVALLGHHNFGDHVIEISEIQIQDSKETKDKLLERKIQAELLKLPINQRNKIQAIKICREIAEMGLKESKDWVESHNISLE